MSGVISLAKSILIPTCFCLTKTSSCAEGIVFLDTPFPSILDNYFLERVKVGTQIDTFIREAQFVSCHAAMLFNGVRGNLEQAGNLFTC